MLKSWKLKLVKEIDIYIIAFFLSYFSVVAVGELRNYLAVINRLSTKQNTKKSGFYYYFNIQNNIEGK